MRALAARRPNVLGGRDHYAHRDQRRGKGGNAAPDGRVSMESEVSRVLYCSRVGKDRLAKDFSMDLVDILLCSRKENLDHEVTGVLVTNQRAYSQVIEGPSSVVRTLIGHIACDLRHSEFRIISQESSDTRLFQEWSMAAISTEKGQEAEGFLFPSFSGQSDATAVHVFCTALRRYLLKTRTL